VIDAYEKKEERDNEKEEEKRTEDSLEAIALIR